MTSQATISGDTIIQASDQESTSYVVASATTVYRIDVDVNNGMSIKVSPGQLAEEVTVYSLAEGGRFVVRSKGLCNTEVIIQYDDTIWVAAICW